MAGRKRIDPGLNRFAAIVTVAFAAMSWSAGAQAEPAAPSPAAMQPAASPLSQDLRLATIGYRLVTANADRCARPEMATGLLVHDISAYDREMRPQVSRAYGLTAGFGLLGVVPDSAAERAGLKTGDEIVGVNGTDLAAFAPDAIAAKASSDRSERFVDLLDAALQKGPATLAVRRGGATLALTLTGQKGCGGRFVVLPDDELNAWTDGYYIAVTSRMMRFAPDDNELAFVIAHEMAHNMLDHAHPQRSANVARGKTAEFQADALAVELLARSGHDLAAPARFLRRSAKLQLFNLHLSHPGNSRRIQVVSSSIDRLTPVHAAAAPTLIQAKACTASTCSSGSELAPAQLEAPYDDGSEIRLPASPERPLV